LRGACRPGISPWPGPLGDPRLPLPPFLRTLQPLFLAMFLYPSWSVPWVSQWVCHGCAGGGRASSLPVERAVCHGCTVGGPSSSLLPPCPLLSAQLLPGGLHLPSGGPISSSSPSCATGLPWVCPGCAVGNLISSPCPLLRFSVSSWRRSLYPVVAHLLWALGAAERGERGAPPGHGGRAGQRGVHGGARHGGVTSLVAAWAVGPRLGRFDIGRPARALPRHSMVRRPNCLKALCYATALLVLPRSQKAPSPTPCV